MGILDILQGSPGATSPWGALYNQPDPQKLAEIYAAAGMQPPQVDNNQFGDPSKFSAVPAPAAPPPSPFGDPDKLSIGLAPSAVPGSGAAPFGFAPSMANVLPSQIAPPPAAPASIVPAVAAPPAAVPAALATSAPPDQAAPVAVGNYQMPRIGSADDFESDETPANAQPTQGTLPSAPGAPAPAPFSLAGAGIGDRLGASVQSFANTKGSGLLGKLANGVGALVTGQRTDPTGVALQLQGDAATANARALLAKNVDPQTVQAAISSARAGNNALLNSLMLQNFGPDKFQHVTVKDEMGRETPGSFDPATGKYTFAGNAGGASGNGTGGLGDMSKTGTEYLATLPPQQAQIVKGMVDGTIQPPSSFALAKPVWQAMLAAAKNVDPNFDANTWAARHKMTTDIASSGNSSMGGILANGKSSFAHLADLSKSMSDLGNASHDFPGGAAMAYLQNRAGNAMGGSDTAAKLKAINDNLGHYGQESTKFYSGTGGGAEERMNALKEMNPAYTSSEEMAAYLEKEKSLMTDRLREKEGQIRSTMGDSYLQQHPVFTPELQQTMNTIDANIAKLRGQPVPAASAAPATVLPPGNYVWTPRGGVVGGK